MSQAHAAPRTAPGARQLAPLLAALFAVLIAFLTLASPAPAMAEETGTPTDQPSEVGLDEHPNRVSGNVLLNSEPLEGVHITVAGGGYTAEVWTNADGQWRVGVPERAEYSVTLDETTLPEGIAVVDVTGADDTPNVKEV